MFFGSAQGGLHQGNSEPFIPSPLLPILHPTRFTEACSQIRITPRLPQVHLRSQNLAFKEQERGCGLGVLWAEGGSLKCQAFPPGRNVKRRSQSHQTRACLRDPAVWGSNHRERRHLLVNNVPIHLKQSTAGRGCATADGGQPLTGAFEQKHSSRPPALPSGSRAGGEQALRSWAHWKGGTPYMFYDLNTHLESFVSLEYEVWFPRNEGKGKEKSRKERHERGSGCSLPLTDCDLLWASVSSPVAQEG